MAFSGKLNVPASQILLLAAWVILLFGMSSLPMPLLIGCALISAGCLVVLGYWIRPALVPAYTGILEPEKPISLLYSTKTEGRIPKLRIGPSNVFIAGDAPGFVSMLFPALSKAQFTVEAIDNEMRVSTRVADESGNLIAELIRNEWKVNPNGSWDRNYSADALEVKDAQGQVILQVRAFLDHIQIQGMWWIDMGPPNGWVMYGRRPRCKRNLTISEAFGCGHVFGL